MIRINRTTVDGLSATRRFKNITSARKYVFDCVGPQDCFGGHYAVSADGVVKVTWMGTTREDLFRSPAVQPAIKLNTETTFYSRGNDVFCRQAGYTHDHERQQIGRVVEVMDNITGDNHDGWRVRHNDGEAHILFNEEAKFATRDAALAHAKRAYLDYLIYLENSDH
jgi:hypothetical protein